MDDKLRRDVSLTAYNTFGIEASAAFFTQIDRPEDIGVALEWGIRPVMVLGGGSNILLTQDVKGLVLFNAIRGVTLEWEGEDAVLVTAGGGMNWQELVVYTVEAGFGGLENLSLIPGTVGAAPVQNIGAYGVELKDVFVRLRAVDLETGGEVVFFHADCAFGYRDSLFKHAAKGRYFITSVTFRLSVGAHRLKLEYGDISRQLAEMGISRPGIADVSHAVTAIRKSKLPDPAELGNAGSFFKNPTVHKSVSGKIKSAFPNLPTFPGIDPDYEKIPAGWLIEQCGWKGKRLGKVGVFPRQALVLVNYGKASGKEIWQLAQDIITSVRVRFDITLEPEVNLL